MSDTPITTKNETPRSPDDNGLVERFDSNSLAFGLTSFQLTTVILTLLLTASASFLGGILYNRNNELAFSEDFRAFWETWEIIDDDFYRQPPTTDERILAALNGLVSSLDDPYSSYAPPQIAEDNREFFTGVFGGIGAVVGQNEAGEVVITRVLDGNPADIAGLQGGDIIQAVDGQSVEGWTVNEAVDIIRGEVDTVVAVSVYRPATGNTLDIRITRGVIERQAVSAVLRDDGIGYIYLADFSAIAATQMTREVTALIDDGARAIVFDMRGNGGGLLDQAVDISDLFLSRGLVLSEQDRSGKIEEFFAENGDIAEDIPLVILVDSNTASAAEIVAGAFQDRDRAVLVGQPTYGKASVQRVHELSNGGELRITWAAWYTPSEQEINGVGLTPDILVEGDVFNEAGQDRTLLAAVDYIDTNYPAENPIKTMPFGG
jgi:carboxyl-terminal processing protease